MKRVWVCAWPNLPSARVLRARVCLALDQLLYRLELVLRAEGFGFGLGFWCVGQRVLRSGFGV